MCNRISRIARRTLSGKTLRKRTRSLIGHPAMIGLRTRSRTSRPSMNGRTSRRRTPSDPITRNRISRTVRLMQSGRTHRLRTCSPTGRPAMIGLLAMTGQRPRGQLVRMTGRLRRRRTRNGPPMCNRISRIVRLPQSARPRRRRTCRLTARPIMIVRLAMIGHRPPGRRTRRRTGIRSSNSSINKSCRTCTSSRIKSGRGSSSSSSKNASG